MNNYARPAFTPRDDAPRTTPPSILPSPPSLLTPSSTFSLGNLVAVGIDSIRGFLSRRRGEVRSASSSRTFRNVLEEGVVHRGVGKGNKLAGILRLSSPRLLVIRGFEFSTEL